MPRENIVSFIVKYLFIYSNNLMSEFFHYFVMKSDKSIAMKFSAVAFPKCPGDFRMEESRPVCK